METLAPAPSSSGFAKAGESADLRRFAFIDLASSSTVAPYGAQWTPISSVVNTPIKGGPLLTNSPTAVDTSFGVFDSMSKQSIGGARSGAGAMGQPLR